MALSWLLSSSLTRVGSWGSGTPTATGALAGFVMNSRIGVVGLVLRGSSWTAFQRRKARSAGTGPHTLLPHMPVAGVTDLKPGPGVLAYLVSVGSAVSMHVPTAQPPLPLTLQTKFSAGWELVLSAPLPACGSCSALHSTRIHVFCNRRVLRPDLT